MLLGESITGEDAFRAGLVSRLVEEELIDSEVSYFFNRNLQLIKYTDKKKKYIVQFLRIRPFLIVS